MKSRGPVSLPVFDDKDRLEIIRILSGRGRDPEQSTRHWPGARVGYLLRAYPALVPSARAQLVLRNLADLMKPRTEPPEACDEWSCSVPLTKLAAWVHCTPRSVQTAIQQLTKVGWPLLMSRPGRPGRASEFRLVVNPFAFAQKQILDAKDARSRRQFSAVQKQAAAFRSGSDGEISPEVALAQAARASNQRDWNCQTPERDAAVIAALKPRMGLRR